MINPKEALEIAENNPYKGTAKQIAKLSISIAQSAQIFDHSVFALYKDKINISPKLFSKLKVIGETLLEVKEQERNLLINQFLTLTQPSIYFALLARKTLSQQQRRAI